MVKHYQAGGIRQGWEFVEARAPIPYRAFLIAAGAWTAFFDNHTREFVAQAELFVLCEQMHVDTCFLACAADDCDAHFCYFTPVDGEVIERQVMVYEEGGWIFSEQGPPQPYEDLEAYQKRRKRDRLNRQLLLEYGAAIGIPVGEHAEFGNDIWLLEWKNYNRLGPCD